MAIKEYRDLNMIETCFNRKQNEANAAFNHGNCDTLKLSK